MCRRTPGGVYLRLLRDVSTKEEQKVIFAAEKEIKKTLKKEIKKQKVLKEKLKKVKQKRGIQNYHSSLSKLKDVVHNNEDCPQTNNLDHKLEYLDRDAVEEDDRSSTSVNSRTLIVYSPNDKRHTDVCLGSVSQIDSVSSLQNDKSAMEEEQQLAEEFETKDEPDLPSLNFDWY